MDISFTTLLLATLSIFLLALAIALFLGKRRLEKALEKTRKESRQLQKISENNRLLAENINDAIYIVDLATMRYTYVSPSVISTHGFAPEEIVGLAVDKVVTPGSLEPVLKILERELEQDNRSGIDPDRYLTLEMEQYRKDGSVIPVETTVKFLRDEAGRPVSIIGVARDITERKKTETVLRETEKAHRLVTDNIREMIAIITLEDQTHIYITPSVEQIRGFTPQEVLAQPFEQVFTPHSYQVAMQAIAEELARDGQPGVDPDRHRMLELEQTRKDGSTVWTEVMGSFIRDESGRPVSVLVAARDISERKKAEAALRESEERYRMLAENINDVIYLFDLEKMQYTFVTPSVQKLYGYTPEEFTSLPLDQMLSPDTLKDIKAAIEAEFKKDGRPGVDPNRFITNEILLYRKDGSPFWVERTARAIRDDNGKPIFTLGIMRDITEKKKAETVLRESEERYRMLAENISEVIYIIDLATMRYKFVTPSAERLYGYTPEEFQTLSLDRLITPKSLDSVTRTIEEELKRDGQPGVDPDRYDTAEMETYRKDGSIFWVESIARFLRDESGKPVAIMGVVRDITEREKAEEILRESEERYRMLAENISEVIFLIDPVSLRHLYITPSIFRSHGYTPEEYMELPLEKIMTPHSFDLVLRTLEAELSRESDPQAATARFVSLELEEYRKDGSTLWTENICRLIRDENGNPRSILGVSRDITERKKAEESMKQAWEAAEAASRIKSEFLANMSHEIRTPMNGVIGMAELLLNTPLSEEQLEYAESLKSSADALLVLINDVLDFSKIEAGKLRLENIDFDLKKLCKEVHDTILPRAQQKRIAYSTVVKEGVPGRLKGDPVRLRQVLINLCENAVKFTEAGSVTVIITMEAKTGTKATLRFEVADTGIGISPEHHRKIFDSFTQVDASTTRRFGGTGLGLAISKRLVDLMGGNIGLASEPGRGSRFWFSLTFDQLEQRPASSSVSAGRLLTPAEKKDSLHILLAEDNAIGVKVISEMLERLGHVVTVAFNGAEAVELFGRENFDLVLMDIQMPVMDGITATKKIHGLQRERGRKVPVVALTANAMAGDRERFLSQGLDDYIAKPVTMATLQAVISRNTI